MLVIVQVLVHITFFIYQKFDHLSVSAN